MVYLSNSSAMTPVVRSASVGSALSTGDLLTNLGEMAAELADFGVREEKQFLFIGGRLADFHGRAKEVANLSEEAINCLVGEEGGGALASLRELLDGFDRHIDTIIAEARHNDEALTQLISQIDRIEQPLQALAKVVKVLFALSFSTRVEGTQGQSGQILLVLADNLKDLAVKISDKTDQVRDRLKIMSELSCDARDKMRRLQGESLYQARSTLHQSRLLVEILGERRQHALNDALLLKSHSRDTSEAIGEVVSSIQFHDITRQQVEHVRDALEEIGAEFSGKDDADIPRSSLIEVCRMQSAQLRHTRGELISAVARIIKSLHDISKAGDRLSQQTRTASGSAEHDGSTFFKDIEPIISTVTVMLEQSVADNRSAADAVGAVLQAMDELSRLLEQIVLIGTEMKLIAFNAGITAAHNMERGAGLGVIAHSIQTLSAQVMGRTQEFAAGYRQMDLLVRALSESKNSVAVIDGSSTVGELNQQSSQLFARLREMNRDLIALLRDMDAKSTSLSQDIMVTANAITIHIDAGHVVDELLTKMEGMVGDCLPQLKQGSSTPMLDRLSKRYTMQSEREIHLRTSRPTAAPAAHGSALSGKYIKGKELGDNIELF